MYLFTIYPDYIPIESKPLEIFVQTSRPINELKQKYYHSQFDKFKHNIKKTWDTIKVILNGSKNKRAFPSFFLVDNIEVTSKEEIANSLSHLNYSALAWGYSHGRIFLLQQQKNA